MSPAAAAQLAFAAEFALFLVAVAGLACALRPGLLSDAPWARSSLASGFLGLATASFLRGTLIVDRPDAALIVGIRLASGAAVALGLIRWKGRRSTVAIAWGLVFLAGAGLALATDHLPLSDSLRMVSAGGFAVGLISAARRAISARIAVNAAGLVLAVVLVVAIAVSFTVSDNVEGQAKARYAARAENEADTAADRARAGLGPARLAARILGAERDEVLERVVAGQGTDADDQNLTGALRDLSSLLELPDPVVLVTAKGTPAAVAPADFPDRSQQALASDPVVAESLDNRNERQGVTVVAGRAYALATAPIRIEPEDRPARFVGLVVVTKPLDETYLQVIAAGGEERLTFALATPAAVIARTGTVPSVTRLKQVARQVVVEGRSPRLQIGGRFVAASAVNGGNGKTIFAFVVSAPADAAEATRKALFRTLFVVALGSALVAVVAAVLVGERIGRGLRTLTAAAQQMQAGALDTRVRVRSDDELGVLGGAFSSMADSINAMTAELRAAALEEATIRARLEAVISGMSEALVAVGADGKVTELNLAAEHLLDAERADLLGRPVSEVLRWRAHDGRVSPFVLSELAQGEPVGADLAVGDGSVPVMVTAGALSESATDAGGHVVVLRDVRREREIDDMKSSILANIGHELRTPLTPIKGYAGMMRDRKLTEEQSKMFAGEIIGGVDQLERVVRQLVTFATIAAGRLDIETAPVPVTDLATRIGNRWRSRVGADHELEVTVDEGMGDVPLDLGLFDQAIDEVIDNAVKFSPEGGPVTVDLAEAAPDSFAGEQGEDAPAAGLLLTVTDHGVGMPADRLAELTEAFSQGDASTTRRFGGLGLGLACADRIVRAHGGHIKYVSSEREGTTVSILLPMESAATGAPA